MALSRGLCQVVVHDFNDTINIGSIFIDRRFVKSLMLRFLHISQTFKIYVSKASS